MPLALLDVLYKCFLIKLLECVSPAGWLRFCLRGKLDLDWDVVQVDRPVVSGFALYYASFYAFRHEGQVYHAFPSSSFKSCLSSRCNKVEASPLRLLEQVACLGLSFHVYSSLSWVMGVKVS